ncbi:MAG TPA: hypothetical protein VMW55_05095 [Nitrosopumilaceae archaeon]|jgi:hypothetical protein|nr:hypothetical protein [Nitrosopumilaceae archaeon]
MRTSTEFETIDSNGSQSPFSIFEFPKINGYSLITEIIFKASRHFPIIVFSFASLKILLVVNDIYTNNIGFAILNSIFVSGDFIFLVQLYRRSKFYQKELDSLPRINDGRLMGDITEKMK